MDERAYAWLPADGACCRAPLLAARLEHRKSFPLGHELLNLTEKSFFFVRTCVSPSRNKDIVICLFISLIIIILGCTRLSFLHGTAIDFLRRHILMHIGANDYSVQAYSENAVKKRN